MARPKGSVGKNSIYQLVKEHLDEGNEVCKFYPIEYEVRKVIDSLKRFHNYVIYRNHCSCGATDRKHFSYEKDWAI